MTHDPSPDGHDVHQSLNQRIDAWFDGDLDAREASTLFQELSRQPEAFQRVVADQAWIDELTRPLPSALVPDVAPEVFERLGLDPSVIEDARDIPRRRAPFALTSLTRQLGVAATVAFSIGLGAYMMNDSAPSSPAPPLRLAEGSPLETGIETVMADINPVRQMVGSMSGAVNAVATFVNTNAAEAMTEPIVEVSFESNETAEKWRRPLQNIRERVNRFRHPGPAETRDHGAATQSSTHAHPDR